MAVGVFGGENGVVVAQAHAEESGEEVENVERFSEETEQAKGEKAGAGGNHEDTDTALESIDDEDADADEGEADAAEAGGVGAVTGKEGVERFKLGDAEGGGVWGRGGAGRVVGEGEEPTGAAGGIEVEEEAERAGEFTADGVEQ